ARFAVGAVEAESGVPGHAADRRRAEEPGSEDEPDAVAAGRDVVLDRVPGNLGLRPERKEHPGTHVAGDDCISNGDGRAVEGKNAALRGRTAVSPDGVDGREIEKSISEDRRASHEVDSRPPRVAGDRV